MTLSELSVIMTLVTSGGGQLNTGQADIGFLWARYPDGTCMRVDISKIETKIPKAEVWINTYDVIEMNRQWFADKKNGWITYRLDPSDPLCRATTGYSTHGLYDVPVPVPPVVTPLPVVPPPTVTTVPAPAGTLTDATGGIWTFGAATSAGGNSLMLNGAATGGFGQTLQLTNGKVYTFTADGKWFVWNGSWTSTVAP